MHIKTELDFHQNALANTSGLADELKKMIVDDQKTLRILIECNNYSAAFAHLRATQKGLKTVLVYYDLANHLDADIEAIGSQEDGEENE
tara:strand:+ start:1540 stop:1806 length:267 start_codon:yes stop_codon:yes gene_type:complete